MKLRISLIMFLLGFSVSGHGALLPWEETEIDYSIYENYDCEQLYTAIGELEANTLNYDSPLYNSRNNNMATIASTVFSPAVLFVGYSKAMSLKGEIDASKNNLQLNYLRNRMGEMRCFLK